MPTLLEIFKDELKDVPNVLNQTKMKIQMTKSQMEELHHHTFFESCPDEVIEKIRGGVRDLSKYCLKSLLWIGVEANDYKILFKSNSDDYYSDGEHEEGLKWLQFSKSMENLELKVEQLKPIK